MDILYGGDNNYNNNNNNNNNDSDDARGGVGVKSSGWDKDIRIN